MARENLNNAVAVSHRVPVLSQGNAFSTWEYSVGPSSVMETLQTTLNRMIVSAKFNLGLSTPLAFSVSFMVMFLFVLSSLFSVFLLWHTARKVVRRRSLRNAAGKERTIMNKGREFGIGSRPVTRITLRPIPKKWVVSPVRSQISSSNSESPCPKRVRWIDEESGCPIRASNSNKTDVDLLMCGIDIETEKVD